jgi:ribonuclease P protein component
MTVFVVSNGRPVARLGVAATRKLGSAVVRNRAKRLAREVFRRHKGAPGSDVVIVPRQEMLDAPFSSLEEDFRRAIERGPGAHAASAITRRTRAARGN